MEIFGLFVFVVLHTAAILFGVPEMAEAGRRRCTLDDYRAGAPKEGFICGRRIPQTLSLVCRGLYRSPGSTVKRSLGSTGIVNWMDLKGFSDLGLVEQAEPTDQWIANSENDNDDDDDEDDADVKDDVKENSAFLARDEAFSYLRHRRTRSSTGGYRTGVYCECCRHRCDVRELYHYCGAGDRDKRSTDGDTEDAAPTHN